MSTTAAELPIASRDLRRTPDKSLWPANQTGTRASIHSSLVADGVYCPPPDGADSSHLSAPIGHAGVKVNGPELSKMTWLDRVALASTRILPDSALNAATGFADGVTFNAGRIVRDHTDFYKGTTNYDSKSYKAGEVTGFVAGMAMPVGEVAIAGKALMKGATTLAGKMAVGAAEKGAVRLAEGVAEKAVEKGATKALAGVAEGSVAKTAAKALKLKPNVATAEANSVLRAGSKSTSLAQKLIPNTFRRGMTKISRVWGGVKNSRGWQRAIGGAGIAANFLQGTAKAAGAMMKGLASLAATVLGVLKGGQGMGEVMAGGGSSQEKPEFKPFDPAAEPPLPGAVDRTAPTPARPSPAGSPKFRVPSGMHGAEIN